MSSKKATVDEAPPSPEPEQEKSVETSNQPPLPADGESLDDSTAPPLPDEPVPGGTEATESGGDEEAWDPAAETDLKGRKAVEEKDAGAGKDTGAWQAVWAPAAGAYYFWNAQTGETTWTNPLAPPPAVASSSQPPLPDEQPPLPEEQPPLPSDQPPLPAENPPLPSAQPPLPGSSWGEAYSAPSSSANPYTAPDPSLNPDNGLPPIDPALAHLLPKSQQGGGGYQTAAFNSRTGRFTPANYQYTVDHLDEANRAKRQEGVFFDVQEWEQKREADFQEKKRKEMEGGSEDRGKVKLSKADMERFRQKKQEKKARNMAWLRG